MPDRKGLIARIQQIRRLSADAGESAGRPSAIPSNQGQLRALETRIAHLEQLVQGLQDSVHREARRSSKRIGELEARIQPAAVARALSQDARERGL